MTRKHFEIVARIIALVETGASREEIDSVLRAQNINYKSERFWRAVDKYAGREND